MARTLSLVIFVALCIGQTSAAFSRSASFGWSVLFGELGTFLFIGLLLSLTLFLPLNLTARMANDLARRHPDDLVITFMPGRKFNSVLNEVAVSTKFDDRLARTPPKSYVLTVSSDRLRVYFRSTTPRVALEVPCDAITSVDKAQVFAGARYWPRITFTLASGADSFSLPLVPKRGPFVLGTMKPDELNRLALEMRSHASGVRAAPPAHHPDRSA